MRKNICQQPIQSLMESGIKGILVLLFITIMVAGCSQAVPESTQQMEEASIPQTQVLEEPPAPTSTAMPSPTVPPDTATPTAIVIPTESATETPSIRRERVAVPRDQNLLRGTLVGDGELAVLLAPMFGEPRGSWMHFAEYIAPLGYTVLAFDFPGVGSSTGEFKFDQVQYDALAMIDHLKSLGYDHIVCMGASIGAAACFEAARIDPSLAGFAIISAPVETTAEDTAGLTMPKLLVTGDEPDLIGSLENAYKLMPDPKQYVYINQKKHGTEMLNTDDQLRDTLVEFLEGIKEDLELGATVQAP
jgi:alpha/beta superfamily hydrolase